MRIENAAEIIGRVLENIKKVIYGKESVIKQTLACWLGGGHVLLEDIPGTGKTMLARAMAASVNVNTKRIQFTPDLLPSDIIGSYIYSKEKGKFIFMPGPIFTTVLLGDEINRATPRTQSALLQAMAEGQCTSENNTFGLDDNFFVIATQNPIEQQGTFPLPEAQLDRFMMRISIGYPDRESERNVIKSQLISHPIDSIRPVATPGDWNMLRRLSKQVKVADSILEYALALVNSTRKHNAIFLGCSPRATIALVRVAQAVSLIEGYGYVKPDFIKLIAPGVLEHRLILNVKARLEGIGTKTIVDSILSKVPVPTK